MSNESHDSHPHDSRLSDDGLEQSAATPARTVGKGPKQKPGEQGGPSGPEPTRYGDWEIGGRCTDF